MATLSHYSNVSNLRRLHSYGVKHACAWPVQLCFFSELSSNQGILSGSASHVNPLTEKADFIPVPYNIIGGWIFRSLEAKVQAERRCHSAALSA